MVGSFADRISGPESPSWKPAGFLLGLFLFKSILKRPGSSIGEELSKKGGAKIKE
jgi:hypothetical protein